MHVSKAGSVPPYHVILLDDVRIGVVEACSGLSMLVVFVALATGLVLLVRRPLVDKLAVAIAEAVKSPETGQRLSAEGSTPVGSRPDEFSAHIRSEIAKWRKLVKDAKLELQQ